MKTTILTTVLLVLIYSNQSFAQQKITFIVNAASPIDRLNKTQVQELFLKTVREWKDGTPVRFFDRVDGEERNFFLRNYLRKSQRQIDQYWIGQKLYSGDSAPTQLPSDKMVVSMVARFPGGIGYVSGKFSGAPGVRVIEVGE